VERLGLWMLGAAMLLVVGLQLVVFWLIMRVLEELSQRETQVAQDMEGCG
jgi:flagellar biogenesis protein FliO